MAATPGTEPITHQFGGDLFGSLAQLFGELEGDGDGHVAETALAGLLDRHGQFAS